MISVLNYAPCHEELWGEEEEGYEILTSVPHRSGKLHTAVTLLTGEEPPLHPLDGQWVDLNDR